MNLDEMKDLWKSQADPLEGLESDAEIIATVTRSAEELDRKVRWRDRLEIGAAVVVSGFFVPLLWEPSWVVRAGVILYMASAVLIWFRLRGARRVESPADAASPLVEVVRRERSKVGAQVELLDSLLWWYILPLCLAILLIFGGLEGLTLLTGAYSLAVVGLGALVLRLNRSAVRRDLRPRYEELTRLLEDAES